MSNGERGIEIPQHGKWEEDESKKTKMSKVKAKEQLLKACKDNYELGKKDGLVEGREGVIKEIEKNMLVDEEGDIFISKRVWECFKHNPFEKKSVIIGKTKGGKEK